MTETTLTLSPPAFLTLTTPDGERKAKLDVYETRRALESFDKQPSEELRMAAANKYIAAKLSIEPADLADSNVFELYEVVNLLIAKLGEERKKKLASIACSPPPTPESPATTDPGP